MYIVVLYSKQEKVISEKLVSKKRLLLSCEVEIYDILQSYTQRKGMKNRYVNAKKEKPTFSDGAADLSFTWKHVWQCDGKGCRNFKGSEIADRKGR